MEILKETGKQITIFGHDYEVIMSLENLAKIQEALGPLEELKLDFISIPVIMEILIGDYCDKHPEVERISSEDLRRGIGPSSLADLQKFIFSLLNPPELVEKAKNA